MRASRFATVMAFSLIMLVPHASSTIYSAPAYSLTGPSYTTTTNTVSCPTGPQSYFSYTGSEPKNTYANDAVAPPTGPYTQIGTLDTAYGVSESDYDCTGLVWTTVNVKQQTYTASWNVVASLTLQLTWEITGIAGSPPPGSATSMNCAGTGGVTVSAPTYTLASYRCSMTIALAPGANTVSFSMSALKTGLSISSGTPPPIKILVTVQDPPGSTPLNLNLYTSIL